MDAAACFAVIPLASLIRRKCVPSRIRKTVGPSEESGTLADLPFPVAMRCGKRRMELRIRRAGAAFAARAMHAFALPGGACIRRMISHLPYQASSQLARYVRAGCGPSAWHPRVPARRRP